MLYCGALRVRVRAGYLNEPSVLWETLSSVDGDSELLDCNMRVFLKSAASSSAASGGHGLGPGTSSGSGPSSLSPAKPAAGGGGGGLIPTISSALGALVGAGSGTGAAAGSGKQLDDLGQERPARPVAFDAASTGSNSSSSSAASEATLVQQPLGAPVQPPAAAASAAAVEYEPHSWAALLRYLPTVLGPLRIIFPLKQEILSHEIPQGRPSGKNLI